VESRGILHQVNGITIRPFIYLRTAAALAYDAVLQKPIQERSFPMGLLDGILGNVVGSMLSGNQGGQQNPLESILGGLAGSQVSGGNPLLQIALALLQQNGGLEGVLGKFRESGMAAQADSWVSTGPNKGISPNELQEALGSSTIGQVASQLGVSQEQAGSSLSQLLPELINHLTPQGEVTSESNDAIGEGLDALTRSLGR
jgi:uncharacterized protein YidB (DUF937 family)